MSKENDFFRKDGARQFQAARIIGWIVPGLLAANHRHLFRIFFCFSIAKAFIKREPTPVSSVHSITHCLAAHTHTPRTFKFTNHEVLCKLNSHFYNIFFTPIFIQLSSQHQHLWCVTLCISSSSEVIIPSEPWYQGFCLAVFKFSNDIQVSLATRGG